MIPFPLSLRRIIAINVSEIGTNRIMTGNPNVINVVVLNPSNDRHASVKPRNSAPQSPWKIEAGWKLYGRKPAMEPARIN